MPPALEKSWRSRAKVLAMGQSIVPEVVEAVHCGFDAFTPDNDPYGEHGFGSIEITGSDFLEDRLLRPQPAMGIAGPRVLL